MTAPEEHRARLPALLLKLAHLMGVVVGWVGFVWLWLLVAARPWDSQGLVWLILGSLLVAPLLTGAWVLHNRSLHRRKGERQAVAAADMGYSRDWHGRTVQADWDTLRHSRLVLVRVDGERKIFEGSLIAGSEPAAAALPLGDGSARPLAVTPRTPLR